MFEKPYFDHVMVIRMITWKSFIRRRDFRNARGIFNQCNRYFCTWKSNVLLHNFRTRHSEFISLSSTLEIHSHTFILQENVVENLIDDRFHDTTVKFTANSELCSWEVCSEIGRVFPLEGPIDYFPTSLENFQQNEQTKMFQFRIKTFQFKTGGIKLVTNTFRLLNQSPTSP